MNCLKIPKYHKLLLSLKRIQTKRAKKLFKIIKENQGIPQNKIVPLMGDSDNQIVSKELKYLMRHRLVKFEKQGKYKLYEVDFEGVEKLQKAISGI